MNSTNHLFVNTVLCSIVWECSKAWDSLGCVIDEIQRILQLVSTFKAIHSAEYVNGNELNPFNSLYDKRLDEMSNFAHYRNAYWTIPNSCVYFHMDLIENKLQPNGGKMEAKFFTPFKKPVLCEMLVSNQFRIWIKLGQNSELKNESLAYYQH